MVLGVGRVKTVGELEGEIMFTGLKGIELPEVSLAGLAGNCLEGVVVI